MSAEDRAASKGGLTDAQFNDLLRVVRETVRVEIRAEFEGRRTPWFDAAEGDKALVTRTLEKVPF